METIESKLINEYLAPIAKTPDGRPIFKLSWSENEYEFRLGTYRTYEGNLFIREETKVEYVRKYNFIHERWMIEQWTPPERIQNREELVYWKKGSYEAFYVFENKGEALPLRLDVVQFLMQRILRPKSSPSKIKSSIESEMERKEKLVDIYTDDYLKDLIRSDIASNLHFGEGIIVPESYSIESPNRRNK